MGFTDEVWWSRTAQPALAAWTEGNQCLHLVEQTVAKDDPDPKALACYGMFLRTQDDPTRTHEEVWLRFVDGRPVSAITTQYLDWCCQKLAAAGKTALLLVWDNASWHRSQEVRAWLRAHNRQVKAHTAHVRIIPCFLPTKSPWLNPIEPKWVHTKRKVVDADGLLPLADLADRVCAALDCPHDAHLTIPEKVA